MQNLRFALPLGLVALASIAAPAACSATNNTPSGSSAGTGGSGTTGAGGGDIDIDAGKNQGGGVFDGKNCGSSTFANAVPGSVLVVLDKSGSMSGGDGQPDKWAPTKTALSTMMSTASQDLRMGLLPFPAGKFDDSGIIACAVNPSTPQCKAIFADGGCQDVDPTPAVDVGPLSMTQGPINNWLSSHEPGGNTPTLYALKTAYGIMSALPTEGQRFTLLITDGVPTTYTPGQNIGGFMIPESNVECKDLPDIEAEAKKAAEGSPTIKTFVIGSPGSEDAGEFLSQVAINGLTQKDPNCSAAAKDCHYQIGKGNFQQDLEDVLKQIAGLVTDCVFAIPMGTEEVDPTLVNVVLETSGGNVDVYFDMSHMDGWDYTDGSQTKVKLYGPACDKYKSEKGAKVDIILGCKTVTK
ncbi:MAG: VWA domain-containing protein [Byssovorax sp.]